MDKVYYDLDVIKPTIEAFDFNNDGIQEIWIKGTLDKLKPCQVHQIFTVETIEPIVIFNSILEANDGITVQLRHGFQAEVTLADGTSFMFPINKDNASVKDLYNSNGVLLVDDFLVQDCLRYLKEKRTDENTYTLEGRLRIVTSSQSKHVCDLVVTWDLIRGIWEVVDYWAIDPE